MVEIGTGCGSSGIWLLRGMRPDGVLTSVDVEPECQRMARNAFAQAGFVANRYRLILFTTKAAGSYLDYRYQAADILLFGRESAGVPDEVAASADAQVVIPIRPGLRSLNVAMAAAMALGEALRQTGAGIQETKG